MFRRILIGFKYNNELLSQNKIFVNARLSNVSCFHANKGLFLNNKAFRNNFISKHNFSTAHENNRRMLLCMNVHKRQTPYSNMLSVHTSLGCRYYVNNDSNRQYSSSSNDLTSNLEDDLSDEVIQDFSNLAAGIQNKSLYLNSDIWKVISESTSVEYVREALIWAHSCTGLPWWATIILATVMIRLTITLPLAMYQTYIYAKVENLQPEMRDITKKLKMEMHYSINHLKWNEAYALREFNKSVTEEWKNLIVRENCHPVKGAVLIIIQIPIWIGLSFALRNMCMMLPVPDLVSYTVFKEFGTGGFGPILNLRESDASYMLPLTFGVANLFIIEMQDAMKTRELSKFGKCIIYLLRGFIICIVPLAMVTPSCMTLFWTTNSMCTVIQNLVLLSPKVRRAIGVPRTPTEFQHPYSELYKRLQTKIRYKPKIATPPKL